MTTRVLDACPPPEGSGLRRTVARRLQFVWPRSFGAATDTLITAHNADPVGAAEEFVTMRAPLEPGRCDLVVARIGAEPESYLPSLEWVRAVGDAIRARRTDGTLGAIVVVPEGQNGELDAVAELAHESFDFVVRLQGVARRTVVDVVNALSVGNEAVHHLSGVYDGCRIELTLDRDVEAFEVAADVQGQKFESLAGDGWAHEPDACVVEAPREYLQAVRDRLRSVDVLGESVSDGEGIRVVGFSSA